MADILAFVERVRSGGDWTAAERARLDALADRFAGLGIDVQVIYGATDAGDPWCVVMDGDDEVLVHVARIGGRFIVHSATDDTLEEGGDLPATLSERLADLEPVREAVVVPFGLAHRQAQTLIALIAVTAFFYETREIFPAPGDHDRMALPDDAAQPLPPLEDMAGQQDREVTVNGAALSDPSPARSAASSHAAGDGGPDVVTVASPPAEAAVSAAPALVVVDTAGDAPAVVAEAGADGPQVLMGSAGDDLLTGGAQAELIMGGDGDDTLQGGGAPAGRLDTLDGGRGDDRIEVTGQVTAKGGEGADVFVIERPQVLGDAETLLGTVTDFSSAQGDQLMDVRNLPAVVVFDPPTPAGFAPAGADPALGRQPAEPPRQVLVDVDNDGRADGHLVVTGRAPVENVSAEDGVDPPVVLPPPHLPGLEFA